MSLGAFGDEGDVCPEGYVTEESHEEAVAEKDTEIAKLQGALEEIRDLRRYKIGGGIVYDPSPEALLKASEVDPIIRKVLDP